MLETRSTRSEVALEDQSRMTGIARTTYMDGEVEEVEVVDEAVEDEEVFLAEAEVVGDQSHVESSVLGSLVEPREGHDVWLLHEDDRNLAIEVDCPTHFT